MSKNALITGITGQDGAYLAQLLIEQGYSVFGTYRRLSTPNFWRLQQLGVLNQVVLIPADLLDSASITEAIGISEPDEIYHLAAQSFVGASFEQPIAAGEITGLGVTRVLEAIRAINPKIKFYQASSSEIYGSGHNLPQRESTPFNPASPYAVAKLYGYGITRVYREAYHVFACNGILFNHESPLRGLEFVTRKISNAVAKIKLGLQKELVLGNMESERDWGYAPEYVRAMWMMLQQDHPDDYVVATGETHSVREFTKKAFGVVNLDYEKFCSQSKQFMRPADTNYLRGDYSKAKLALGWEPVVKAGQLAEIMVKADVERWERWMAGDRTPWDAPQYPDESNIRTRSLRI